MKYNGTCSMPTLIQFLNSDGKVGYICYTDERNSAQFDYL